MAKSKKSIGVHTEPITTKNTPVSFEENTILFDIIQQLAETSKRNEKLEILEKNSSNKLLEKYLLHSLSPFLIYRVKELTFPSVKTDLQQSNKSIMTFIDEVLPVFINIQLSGLKLIEFLSSELQNYCNNDIELIKRMILKDIKCGISVKTANKVFPDLVKEVPYMRCSKIDCLGNIVYPAIIQEKSDGSFCNIIIKNKIVSFMTRNGTPFFVKSIADELLSSDLDNVVLIGELLMQENHVVLERQISNGNINKLIKSESTLENIDKNISILQETEKKTSKMQTKKIEKLIQEKNACIADYSNIDSKLIINCWDFIPVEDWENGLYAKEYNERFSTLLDSIKRNRLKQINTVDYLYVYNEQEAIHYNTRMLSKGKEGSVLKNLKTPFKDGTSTQQIKMKGVFDADLLCVGWYYGKEGTEIEKGLGGLKLVSSDGKLTVDVGSGFSREQRGLTPVDSNNIAKGLKRTSLDFDKEYLGKIIAVEFNSIISSKGSDTLSLFLPTFIEVRFDKETADNLEDIQKSCMVAEEE